jgi:hypothetical protein
MRNGVFNFAIAFAMSSVFVTMFGVQVGAATAAARMKTGAYAAITSDMSIQRLHPVY